jgi:N-acyl-D-aspartate/D-glutamate deacylase
VDRRQSNRMANPRRTLLFGCPVQRGNDRRTLLLSVVAILALSAMPAAGDASRRYDLVLTGGRVLDPATGLDARRDVGVQNGRIVAVSERPLQGRASVDVSGLVVAPGFIDLHSHGLDPVSSRLQAQDGVTTHLELELGVYPVEPWYVARQGHSLINFGSTVAHGAARASVAHGVDIGSIETDTQARSLPPRPARWADDALRPDEILRLEEKLQQGLDAGALGIGFGLAYTPGASREEIWRSIGVAARNGARSFAHLRFGGSGADTGAVAALQEVLADAASLGAGLHVAHVGSTGRSEVPVMLRMIDAARARGVDVTTEVYPWTAASTGIGSAIFDEGWETRVGATPADLEWPATGERLTAATFAKYRAEQPRASVIAHIIPEPMVEYALRHPGVAIVSDGPSYLRGPDHPRGAGTFARVLGRYVRERRVLTLMDAVAKMTIVPARILESSVPAMARKGRIQPGADADITVFSAEEVGERATFSAPLTPSVGIRHVIVGGVFVVRDGRLVEGVSPGAAIRREASRRVTRPS